MHTPIKDADGLVAFVAQNAIDITELCSVKKQSHTVSLDQRPRFDDSAETFGRAQMHEALIRILHDERNHLRSLFNQAPGFLAVLSGDQHVFELVNEAYYQLVGHRELIGKSVWDALPEVAGQGFEEMLDTVFATGTAFVGRGLNVAIHRRPGAPATSITIDALYQPLFGANGQITGIFVQGHDVSEAYAAQLAQRESEERLQDGLRAARMLVWDWEILSRKIVFSDHAPFVLGRTADTIDAILESVIPEDAKKLKAAHARAIASRGGYQEIVRFRRPDNGRTIWLEIRGKVSCDAAGRPFSVRGVTLDVSERMLAEEDRR